MRKNKGAAALCAGLFALSFVILNVSGGKGYLPSSDYIDTAVSVFYELDDTVSAIHPCSANMILNLLKTDEKYAAVTSADRTVLPPLLTPPVKDFISADSVD